MSEGVRRQFDRFAASVVAALNSAWKRFIASSICPNASRVIAARKTGIVCTVASTAIGEMKVICTQSPGPVRPAVIASTQNTGASSLELLISSCSQTRLGAASGMNASPVTALSAVGMNAPRTVV